MWLARAACMLFPMRWAWALVYCVTNSVDVHQSAPTGTLADSGWGQTVPVDLFLGTLIHTNALLTAGHIWEIAVGDSFDYEGTNHLLTAKVSDADSDLAIFFFEPPVTNYALINIETNDIGSRVVLQGRGMERGGEVIAGGGVTNGWEWAWDKQWRIRRWGVNQYVGEGDDKVEGDGVCAVAAFDNNGDPDECMLSVGDSGGPGFIRTGSGWKLATVNYAVAPSTFTLSTNSLFPFNASLYDCAGLYYQNNSSWVYVPLEESPSPCLMANTRTAKRVAWITNAVSGITFPADLGVSWLCGTNFPSVTQSATGLWFGVVAANAGPYTARDLTLDFTWSPGVRVRGSAATRGTFAANRWSLPALEDGAAATLRVDTVVWRAAAGWGTNRVEVMESDKPDCVTTNNAAAYAVFLPETATRLTVQ